MQVKLTMTLTISRESGKNMSRDDVIDALFEEAPWVELEDVGLGVPGEGMSDDSIYVIDSVDDVAVVS